MAQINTKPQPAKTVIDASMPKNISAADKKALEQSWADQAQKRNDAIARETKIPDLSSLTLGYQLRKFGKHWQAYHKVKDKFVPILPAPSLLTSAMDAMIDAAESEALRS